MSNETEAPERIDEVTARPWRNQAMARLGWLRGKGLVNEFDVPLLQQFIEGNASTSLVRADSQAARIAELEKALASCLDVMREARDGWDGYAASTDWCNAWDAARAALKKESQ